MGGDGGTTCRGLRNTLISWSHHWPTAGSNYDLVAARSSFEVIVAMGRILAHARLHHAKSSPAPVRWQRLALNPWPHRRSPVWRLLVQMPAVGTLVSGARCDRVWPCTTFA
jgi:hypothetical protein